MTRKARLALGALLLLSLFVVPSCDSDQPLSVEGQQVDIYFNASGSIVPLFRVWELTKDTDQNGIPDDVNGDGVSDSEDITLWCEWGDFAGTSPDSVPWAYSLRISVLRAGESTPEIITSDLAATSSGNKAGYDSRVLPGVENPEEITLDMLTGACSNNPARFCNPAGSGLSCSSPGTCTPQGGGTSPQRFRFNNSTGSSLSNASLKVLRAGRNTLTDLCTGDSACISSLQALVGHPQALVFPLGECPGDPTGLLGTPVIDQITQDLNPDTTIFGLDLRKGDTVIVEARLSNEIPGGGSSAIIFGAFPGLQTVMTVDGSEIQPNEVVGNLTSSDPAGPAISFAYISQ